MASKKGVPGFEDKSPEEQEIELQRMFRETFSASKESRFVFNVLLDDLRLFTACETDREHALNDYAKFLLNRRCGINDFSSITDAALSSYTVPDIKK